jgi:hypothetical protein
MVTCRSGAVFVGGAPPSTKNPVSEKIAIRITPGVHMKPPLFSPYPVAANRGSKKPRRLVEEVALPVK